jgi:hypothetical protein
VLFGKKQVNMRHARGYNRFNSHHNKHNKHQNKRQNVYIRNQNKTNEKSKHTGILLVEHEQYVSIGEWSERMRVTLYYFEDYAIHQARTMRKKKRSAMQLEYMSNNSYFSNINGHTWAISICGNNDHYSPFNEFSLNNDNNTRGKCAWDRVKYQYEFDLLVIATMSNNSYIAIEASHIFSKLWIRCMRNKHISNSLFQLPTTLIDIIEGYL